MLKCNVKHVHLIDSRHAAKHCQQRLFTDALNTIDKPAYLFYNIPVKRNKPRHPLKTKLQAVKTHLATNQPLRKTAQDFGISYKTLWNWLQRYQHGGEDALGRTTQHTKEIPESLQRKVMLLKERKPSLSIEKAQKLLEKQHVHLSRRKIWQIWKLYGLARWHVRAPLNPFGTATPEINKGILHVKALIRKGDVRAAVKILNSLPSIPHDPIIREIPEEYLSTRRRLERLYLEFGEMPFPELRRKAHQLGAALERKDYIYSSIIANFMELMALGWIKRPKERIALCNRLVKKMRNMKSSALWFLFHCEQAMAYAELLQMNKAIQHMKECRRLVYLLPYRFYQASFGDILTSLGRYKDAHTIFKKALKREKEPEVIGPLALKAVFTGPSMAGDYRACRKMLVKAARVKHMIGFSSAYILNHAYISFGQGRLAQASGFFLQSLEKTFKGELHNRLYAAVTGLAGVAMALNKKTEAKMYLSKYLPLMKKYKLAREILILQRLLGSTKPISKEARHMRILHLLDLLVRANQTARTGDYRQAYNFAKKQRLLGLFHRWIVFFPNPVLHLLEKGKKTGLPRALLKFPLFNQNMPVYHLKLLGDIVITKNQSYLKARLTPKEKALLVHLASRSGSPGGVIALHSLYRNFWEQSPRPSERLLHLMASIKKKLMIPSHLLNVSSASGEPCLINRGVYMTTDYGEFGILIAQAKTLERANEWHFAQKEYLRAFKLLRGQPFMRMYDNWSEDMRSTTLNKIENEMIHFVHMCKEHHNKTDAQRVLERATTIIPHSERLKTLLSRL